MKKTRSGLRTFFLPIRLAAALALLLSLLCTGMALYIYWHEARGYWLLAAALGLFFLFTCLLLLSRLGKSRGKLAELWKLCQEEQVKPLDFLLRCAKEKTAADRKSAAAGGEESRAQEEISALQNQMNPHFLYNTLDSIRGQALFIGAREIADMTEALSAFFRYSISQKGAIVTLKDELKNVDAYMQIQAFRFENRISLKTQLDLESMPQELYVPKMILQPLVENSIVHGLEEKEGGGEITVRIRQSEKRLLISVSDDGVGMDEETLSALNASIRGEGKPAAKEKRSSGIALRNVNRRIQLHFGENYGLSAHSILGMGTEIAMTLPVMDINNVAPEYLKLIH